MNKSVALVDFDGVILKNQNAKQYINKKIKQFVHRKLNTTSKAVVDEFAKHVYCSHGHTQHGLSKHGFITTLPEFNYFVYDSYDARSEYAKISLTEKEKKDWESFIDICKNQNIDVKLFSNAPINWLSNFIEYEEEIFDLSEYLERYRHSEDNSKYMLKPTRHIEKVTSSFLSNQYYQHYYLIDDSLRNLAMISKKHKYTSIWYNDNIGETKRVSQNLFILDNLKHFNTIIKTSMTQDTSTINF